ncbi:hypothetical protein GCM10020254_45560 [Streptomyces goshikiensis]
MGSGGCVGALCVPGRFPGRSPGGPRWFPGGSRGVGGPLLSVGPDNLVDVSSLALYRRYRPESFAEVIGQEHVTVPP